MKMRKLMSVMLAFVMVLALAGCGSSENAEDEVDAEEEKFEDAEVAAEEETLAEENSDKLYAKVIDVDLTNESYAFAVDKDNEELLNEVNDLLKEIMENGTLDEITEKYFTDNDNIEGIELGEADDSKDQLIVATEAGFEPFEYTVGDKIAGIDMEVAQLLADKLGKELVIQNMDFDAVIESVETHKCDIGMAGLTVTDERKEIVNFSDEYFKSAQRLIVPSTDKTFDECKSAEDIEKKLNEMDSSTTIGVQRGTTGQFYVEGSEDWGYDGFPVTCTPYSNGSMAVTDMLNGSIQYVVIDRDPANFITSSINEMR